MARIEHRDRASDDTVSRALQRLEEAGVDAGWEQGEPLSGRAATGTLLIGSGEGSREFPAVVTPTINSADLTLIPHDRHTVLITAHVPAARAHPIMDRGWGGYLDTAGNASLRGPGVLIEITGKRAPEPVRIRKSSAPFTRAGLPVTLALLLAHEQGDAPLQRDLAAVSGASIGTVNRVVRALRDRTPAMTDAKNRLLRPEALEDEWVSAYSALQPRAWPEERFSSDVWKTPQDLLGVELPESALIGSELAAESLRLPIRAGTALVHAPEAARGDLIRLGRLRRADDGMVRLRPAFWPMPLPVHDGIVPRALLRADLLLEDDPRIDEIQRQLGARSR